MKILIISDGNGIDVDNCPKWPSMLKHLTGHDIENRSVIGSSNETMFNLLRDTNLSDIDHAIIQWSFPQRFDTVINEYWIEQAENDPIYHFNIHKILDRDWWISSGSKNDAVREYHTKFVREPQAKHRTIANIWAATAYLRHKNVPHTFSLCYDIDLGEEILDLNWAWHKTYGGIRSFTEQSKHGNLDDAACPRPHPLVQLEWIKEVLAPVMEIKIDTKRYQKIEESFERRTRDNLLLQL